MNTQDIGDYIRAKRKSSGWSQEQFAERLDVSTKTVSNWENGEFTSIKNENLEKLSAVFGVSIGEIYAGKDIVGLSDDDKLRIDQTIKNLNERVDDVQTITIKVEDRGILSMEMGCYAFGFAAIALAVACWAAFPQTALLGSVCLILFTLGIVFMIFGKRAIRKLEARIQGEREKQQQKT